MVMVVMASTSGALDSIFRIAVCSRIFLFCLSAFANLIVPDHKATDVFIYKYENGEPEELHLLDHVVFTLFGGLVRWDANYFLHIARYGYTEENMLAFFPLFPLLTRLLALLLYQLLSNFLSYAALLLVASVVINFCLFVRCATLLYELTERVVKDDVCAYYSAIVFCVNPASVFFSAPYSETLFTYLTLLTVLNSFSGNFLVASLVCGLSCATRSNGTLNFGFILYSFLLFFIKHFALSFYYALTFLVLLVVFATISLAPFYLFQLYSYVRLCPDAQMASSGPNTMTLWCNSAIPLAYSHIQNRYWNVGFLNYYEVKQIPNFLLAAPIIYFLLTSSYRKMVNEKRLLSKVMNLQLVFDIRNSEIATIDRLNCLVPVVHVALLTVFCIFFVHIQVATRMLCSSSPVFYWFVADRFKANLDKIVGERPVSVAITKMLSHSKQLAAYIETNQQKPCSLYSAYVRQYWRLFFNNNNTVEQLLLIAYCLGYFVIGTVLFSNFYPWT